MNLYIIILNIWREKFVFILFMRSSAVNFLFVVAVRIQRSKVAFMSTEPPIKMVKTSTETNNGEAVMVENGKAKNGKLQEGT